MPNIDLTLDVEVDGVALCVTLRVAGGALVAARPESAHPLQNEAPVAHDHAAPRVRHQHSALKEKKDIKASTALHYTFC